MSNALTRTEWATRIGSRWQEACAGMREATFQIGHDLIQSKKELDHGEFIAMIESDLPFGKRSAQMFKAIAEDDRLSKAKSISLLPPHWGTLYKISRFDDESLERFLDDGTINPDCTYAEINKVLRMERVKADEQPNASGQRTSAEPHITAAGKTRWPRRELNQAAHLARLQ